MYGVWAPKQACVIVSRSKAFTHEIQSQKRRFESKMEKIYAALALAPLLTVLFERALRARLAKTEK